MRRGRGLSEEDENLPSTSRARTGLSGTGTDQKFVKDSVENSLILLESIAKRLKTNKEGIDHETIVKWQEKIKLLTSEAVLAAHRDQLYESTANLVSNEKFVNNLGSSSRSSSSCVTVNALDGNQQDLGTIRGEINSRVKEQLLQFHFESAQQYKNIFKHIESSNDEDEDLIMEEVEMTEAMTKCPYTMKLMIEPFKNNNPSGNCIHHVSKEGLDAMFKSKQDAKCPTAGCKGTWRRQSCELDEAFKRKIERFLRVKEIRTQQTQSYKPSVEAEELF